MGSLYSPAGGWCCAWGHEVWGKGGPPVARWPRGKTPRGLLPSLTHTAWLQMTATPLIPAQCPLLTLKHRPRWGEESPPQPGRRPAWAGGLRNPDGHLHLSSPPSPAHCTGRHRGLPPGAPPLLCLLSPQPPRTSSPPTLPAPSAGSQQPAATGQWQNSPDWSPLQGNQALG